MCACKLFCTVLLGIVNQIVSFASAGLIFISSHFLRIDILAGRTENHAL